MAGMDSVGQHPLSLKVMRVSRPSLASNWEPFFSSSSSFSAHSTASPLSLQGSEPLPGHPKTLRDLTHASTLLTVPTSFGAIQLGETFSCVLSVNNEVDVPVDYVRARVEMQTATNKVVLTEVVASTGAGEGDEQGIEDERGTLLAGDSLELAVSTEIKELGQHVLGCSVTYRTPAGMRPATTGGDDSGDPFIQTFRKFYKFIVTNPLSVKSKVHVPKSPTALLSRTERDKVFLEVHIQNLTQGPLWFEKIRLEPMEGWNVVDANNLSPLSAQPEFDGGTEKSIFSGTTALMPAQDMRQYIYILTPKVVPRNTSVSIAPVPGTIIPLGRLDISWRSPMGEPGRLLTSVLSRRIPLPAPPSSGVAPASALPPYLQKTVSPNVPRPRSPSLQQQAQHRTATPPPQRPASPLKRSTTPGAPARPQSPATNAPPVPPLSAQSQPPPDIQVDLVLLERPNDATVFVEKPFLLRFSLAVSALQPYHASGFLSEPYPRKTRVLTLAVQHTLPAPPPAPEQTSVEVRAPSATRALKRRTSTTLSFETTGSGIHSPASHAGSIDVLTPRRVMSPPPVSANANTAVPISAGGDSMVTSPTAMAARAANAVTVGGLTERLRRVALSEALGLRESESGGSEAFGDGDEAMMSWTADARLPSPYSSFLKEKKDEVFAGGKASGSIQFSGTSAVFLPPVSLIPPTSLPVSSTDEIQAPAPVQVAQSPGTIRVERGEACVEFTLSYIPRTRGFARIGGLRVLLIRDQEKEESANGLFDGGEEEEATLHTQGEVQPSEAQILREWDVVAELWVR